MEISTDLSLFVMDFHRITAKLIQKMSEYIFLNIPVYKISNWENKIEKRTK